MLNYIISLVSKKDGLYYLLEKEFEAKDDNDAMEQVKTTCKFMTVLSKYNKLEFQTIAYLNEYGKWGKLN